MEALPPSGRKRPPSRSRRSWPDPSGTAMRPRSRTLRARYVFPVDGPPVADGVVTIEAGRISHVGPADGAGGRTADLDLGNAAIVPGFANAHTHLELSALGDDGGGGLPVAEEEIAWLRRVIDQ